MSCGAGSVAIGGGTGSSVWKGRMPTSGSRAAVSEKPAASSTSCPPPMTPPAEQPTRTRGSSAARTSSGTAS